MTTIIGLVHAGKAYMGCDSQTTHGWAKTIRPEKDQKIIRRDGFLIGCSGNTRLIDLVKAQLQIPSDACIPALVEAMRKCFDEHGFLKKDSPQEFDGGCLVICNGELHHIANDFSTSTYADGFYAIGTGSDFALGALAVLDFRRNPKKTIRRALEVAAKFDMGSSGPFYVEEWGSD